MSDTQRVVGGRSDVARLLGIPEWRIASYGNPRYPYKIRPTARRARGTGKKGLYGLADVYKIAVADRMLAVGLEAHVIGEVIRALFPRKIDPLEICVKQRARKIEEARFMVVNFALAPWVQQGKLPKYWREGETEAERWVMLKKWNELSSLWAVSGYFGPHQLRTAFVIPFDELLAEVDARLLGRPFYHDDKKGLHP